MQPDQTWEIKEIAEVDPTTGTGKLRLEVEGHGHYTSLLWLYVPIVDIRSYRVGDKFKVSVGPKLAALTVMQ